MMAIGYDDLCLQLRRMGLQGEKYTTRPISELDVTSWEVSSLNEGKATVL